MGTPPTCSKCRRAGAVEGETWCGGCLALEGCLSSLRGNWWSSTHRRLGEEILIQAHRQLKAVKSLDTALQSFSDSWEARYRKAANPGVQRPSHPVLPPRGRASLVEAPQAPPVPPPAPVKEEPRRSEERSPDLKAQTLGGLGLFLLPLVPNLKIHRGGIELPPQLLIL